MNYSQTEFLRLLDQIESQSGEHLDKPCTPQTYNFTGEKSKPMTFGSCGNFSLFSIPYAAQDVKGKDIGARKVQVCAVEDDLGRWPRFGGNRFAKILGEDPPSPMDDYDPRFA
jgi:hypothetical protein